LEIGDLGQWEHGNLLSKYGDFNGHQECSEPKRLFGHWIGMKLPLGTQ